MSTLNNILAIAEQVTINDQRFVGMTITRNQRISTSEIVTVIPFQFDFKPHNYLSYANNRALLANLRANDKSLEQYLNFGSTGWLNYIAYQGDLTSGQISGSTWSTSSAGTSLIMTPASGISSGAYVVRAGDFCQMDRYSYIATQDVLRGSGGTVNIPVHRNVIYAVGSSEGCVIGQYGTTISMGGNTYTGVTFPVILQAYPTYTLIPTANDSFISWTGQFKAFESVL